MGTLSHLSNISGIYVIKNKLNNKMYIGSSVAIKKRLEKHLYLLRHDKHCNQHLQSAYNKDHKYFEFNLLKEVANNNDLKKTEQKFLDQYKTYDKKYGYNKSCTAERPTITKEGKQALKLHNTGKKYSKETNAKKGLPGPFNPFYGKSHTNESKKKYLESRGLKSNGFICIETQEIFYFFKEAAIKLNCRMATISDCLKKTRFMSNNFHFIYIDEIPFKANIKNNKVVLNTKQISDLINIVDPKRKLFKCLETNKLFTSVILAAKEYKICRVSIARQLRGERKTTISGYSFVYV